MKTMLERFVLPEFGFGVGVEPKRPRPAVISVERCMNIDFVDAIMLKTVQTIFTATANSHE